MTAALAVVLTSTVMYPVFTDSLWFAESIGVVLGVAAAGALTRLRLLPVPACLAVGVASLLLYLNLVFEAGHSLLLVIPTPGSVASLWDLAGTGFNEANRYAPPVPNLSGLLLLTVAGVGITAVLTDLIAVRLRSAALAGLPLLVLFTVPVMLNAPHSQLATGLVFCAAAAGYLALLSTDGRERIRVWGRLVSLWRGTGATASRTHGPDTRALAAAGRRVGLASIVLALCVPLLVPGLHPSKLFPSSPGIGGTGGGSGVLTLPSALTQAVSQLRESHPNVVFTYTTTATKTMENNDAQYFRQYVFDTLADGTGWQVTDYAAGARSASSPPGPQGLSEESSYRQVSTVIAASKNFPAAGAQPTFLPLVYPATAFDAPGKWLADPDLMVYSAGSSVAGQSYHETSLYVDPTTTQLEGLGVPSNTPNLSPDLQLPSSYKTAALLQLARAHAGNQSTEIGEVDGLANWLSGSQFSYDLNASQFDSAGGLQSFLTKSKTGFCVQSAYAMTVLSRLLGIPARFVVGYTSGTLISGDTYKVMNTDAHAWTVVYFPTFGWLRFEPTPSGQGTAHATNYMGSSAGTGELSGDGSAPVIKATGAGQPNRGQAGNPFGRGHTQPGVASPLTGAAGQPASTPWAAIVLAIIAAIVLACGIIAMLAPPAQWALPSAGPGPARRRRPVSVTSVSLVAAAAVLIALALYRLLSRTAGLDLGARWATVGLAFGVAIAVALVAPSLLRLALRRWRWIRAGDDASRAHAAWREFHDDLADFGVSSRPSEPPRTLAGRVTAGMAEPAGEAIRRLALAEERARYAASPAGSQHLRRDGITARHGLAASVRRRARWRARIFPASLLTALAEGSIRLPDHLAAGLSRRRAQHRPTS